ncbi:MAG TPA: hypothetical protein VHM28_00185 [Anaerolineales bacterium]|jgi:HEAT repeat protein|nr:hypothetical protein [Anaerolineales bacterium]
MSALSRIAHFQNRRDEIPNQELARDLAAKKDKAGIREIAKHLWDKNKNVQADCIKVLYEVGYINPALIAGYAEDFIKLLKSKNNRLVWGAMTALGTIAELKADLIFTHLAEIQKAMNNGSVITMDNGVQTLARVASKSDPFNKKIFPYLLNHLRTCRPKDVAQHAEKTLPAVNSSNKKKFTAVLEKRMQDLSGSSLARVKKVIKATERR